jgi:ketosteroid isomerase-like protein
MTREDVETVLEAVFEAWNARDIPTMLQHFAGDLVFVEHAGPGGRSYKVRHGAPAFGGYLQTYLDVADCVSTMNHLAWDGIYARTVIAFSLHHRATRLRHVGRFRQVIRFRGRLVSHLDEYHDVDAASSFWGMIGD